MTPYNSAKLVAMATIRSPILRGREIVRFYKYNSGLYTRLTKYQVGTGTRKIIDNG